MEFLLYLLNNKGISAAEIDLLRNSFFLLLSLPIVTTLTGAFRHIIGLKSLSVYAPIILTFAFYQLGYINESITLTNLQGDYDYLRGLQFGLALYFIVFIISTSLYSLIRSASLHYIPKTTIVMIGVVISLILSIVFGTFLFERKGLIYLDIFSILMIVTLSETFVSSMARKSFKSTALVGFHTLITAIIAYSFISISKVKEVSINYALLLLGLLVLVNLYIGSLRSLRLTELWRFREILLQDLNSNGKSVKKNTKKQKKSPRSK
ncbi:MAG: hypothetical protein Kow0081_3810 [Candidatus Dojkabacteria bacterium]